VDLAVDAALAHAARDELGHLGPEIDDEDAVGVGGRRRHGGLIRDFGWKGKRVGPS